MRTALFASWYGLLLSLPLAGCLQAVGPDGLSSDGSLAAGPDASGHHQPPPAPDGSVLLAPDAAVVTTCATASQCPTPDSPDPVCHPMLAACEDGQCTAKPAPRIWDQSPGACLTAADCACQTLERYECAGSWACTRSGCIWQCGGCQSDGECPVGQICQEWSCGEPRSCAAGCRASRECLAGKICQPVAAQCGDAYGLCQDPPGCTSDSQCPPGTACDDIGIGTQKYCITGCHDSSNCPPGESCHDVECPVWCDDWSCACLGTCEPDQACTGDDDCPGGTVCGTTPDDCELHCLEGCHTDADCRANQECAPPPPCTGCGCDHGTCVTLPPTCVGSAECQPGEVCAFEDSFTCSGARRCVPGCLTDTDCPAAQVCALADCGPCCVGTCMEVGCASDADCRPGTVCEGCSGEPLRCMRGCRTSSECGPGQECLEMDCTTCPCPGQCRPVPNPCNVDEDCGAGEICQYVDHFACSGTKACQAGCRDGSDCPQGEACALASCGPCCPGQCVPLAGCQSDADCAPGTVCEPGLECNLPNACVPGCHTPEQCGPGETCVLVPCATCPCPGQCTPATCSGDLCSSTLHCLWNQSYCEPANNCCTACPPLPAEACNDPSQCLQPQGIDNNGCRLPSTCGSCCACPATADPVCGTNYQTYGNSCMAACAGALILHWGACEPFEGMGCGYPQFMPQQPCGANQYCRDVCPVCDTDNWMEGRCTRNGACVTDLDCPAGLTANCQPGTSPVWHCGGSGGCWYACL